MPQPVAVQWRHHSPSTFAISGTAKNRQHSVQPPQVRV
jgi:hypothetical protein